MLARHVPCVIAMRGPISDAAAAAFGPAFYRALGDGRSVAAAFRHARATLTAASPYERDSATLRASTPPTASIQTLFISCPRVRVTSFQPLDIYRMLATELGLPACPPRTDRDDPRRPAGRRPHPRRGRVRPAPHPAMTCPSKCALAGPSLYAALLRSSRRRAVRRGCHRVGARGWRSPGPRGVEVAGHLARP